MLTNCYLPLTTGHLPKRQRASQRLALDAQFASPPYPVLPSHVFPSLLSTRPTPHAQRCEFLRFTQISLQPPLFCSHSLSSVEGKPSADPDTSLSNLALSPAPELNPRPFSDAAKSPTVDQHRHMHRPGLPSQAVRSPPAFYSFSAKRKVSEHL